MGRGKGKGERGDGRRVAPLLYKAPLPVTNTMDCMRIRQQPHTKKRKKAKEKLISIEDSERKNV